MLQHSFLGLTTFGFHNVAYTEWGDDRSSPPVICVHGLTRNGRDFDRLADSLQATRRVLCPDIVGRGKSDRLKDPTLYTYATYLSDMNALVARAGTAQIDWVGTSMGGLMGMMLAAQPNTPIRKLIINDVGPYIAVEGLKRIANYVGLMPEFADIDAAERFLRKNYAPFGIERDEDWLHMAETSMVPTADGKFTLAHDPGIAVNFQNLANDVDLWGIYDAIRCPTLVLRGANSDILSRKTAEEMTTRGPRAQLVEWADVGHAPALVDKVQIQIINEFLAR